MQRYPLSKTEYGIYAEQVLTGNTAYNVSLKITLSNEIDLERLKKAIGSVLDAHSTLKTGFAVDESGNPYKYIRDCTLEVQTIEDDTDLYSLIKPFDLHNDILFRCYIIKSSGGNTLFFDIHHIIFDGTSIELLIGQLCRAYAGEHIEAETYTAADAALEEAARLHTEEYEQAKSYYLDAFDGIDTDSSLYMDKNDREPIARQVVYPLEKVDFESVRSFAKHCGVKLSTVFSGAFSYLLSKYTGNDQALFSTIYNGRDSRFANSVGMFVKTYPVYADFSGDDTIREFLKKLDAQITLNRKNDLYSYADFCADTKLKPSVLFGYQGNLYENNDFFEYELIPSNDTRADFELTVRGNQGRFFAYAVYRQDLFDDEIVRNMAESFNKILSELLHKEKLSEIDMLTDAQLKELDNCNHSESDYEVTDIVTLFRRQAEKMPDHTAVVYLDRTYTYRELDRLTENTAAFLRKKGIGRNQVVSVLIPRCEYMAIASFGILKSGAGYQPLDPSYPTERLEFMIQDADAQYLIADRSLMDKIPHYQGPVLYTDEIPSLPDSPKIDENPAPDDLFIMLYTSGSTGIPKGVMLEHRNLCSFCHWFRIEEKLTPESRTAAYASYGFDACMMDLYPTLTTGAAVYIIDESIRLDLLAINRYFEENKITNSFMTTQVGRQYAELFPDASYPHILAVGGEKLVPVEPPTGYRFLNAYGPTECTIFTHSFWVDKLYERVPIGKTLFNMKNYIIDKNGRRVPMGVPGELVLAGHQVGRGYLNRPEQNAKAFICNPFSDEAGYERAYLTGDIARLRSDGSVDFIGRNDDQVKIRGFRIELSEVESIIRKFSNIKDATVQAFDEESGGKYIAAYVVSDETVDTEALAEFVRQEKPPYMVPAVTIQIDRIPLNQNQKVNKKALPQPQITTREKDEEHRPAAPLNVLEQGIKDIVSEIVRTTDFGITDSFADLGLTSISSIRLAMLIYQKYNVQIDVRSLVSNGCIQSVENDILSALLAQDSENTEETVQTSPEAQSCRLSFAQQGVYAECMMDPESVRYNIPYLLRFPAEISAEQLKNAVLRVIEAHPYVLCRFVADSDSEIIQEPIPDCTLDIPVSQMTAEELESYKSRFVRPFRLDKGPCLRFEIVKTDELVLLADMHHLISDGASVDIFFGQLCQALDGTEPQKETYSYYDFAAEEKITPETEEFFAGQMAEMEEATQLIPDVFEKDLPHIEKLVSVPTDIAAVRKFALHSHVTPAAVYLAACCLTFGRYLYEDSVSIATISNGRSNVKLGNTMGMFVNTLPIVTALNHQEKTADYVQRTAQIFSDTIAHENYPFARIASRYDFHPSVSYAYQVGVLSEYNTKYGSVTAESLDTKNAKVPVSVFIDGTEEEARITVAYDSSMYSAAMMTDLAKCIANAAAGLTACETLADISLTDDFQWKILDSYNKPWDLDYDMNDTAVSKFKRNAAQFPDKVAAVFKEQSYTYKELDELTDRLAAKIYRIACEITGKTSLAEEVAAIILPRNEQTIILPLAAVKAGLGYEPLDPSYPPERLNFMVKDANVCLMLADDSLCHVVDEYKGRVVTVSELYAMNDVDVIPVPPSPEDMFIMLYTSGSTGTPKGCQIEHRNMVAFTHGMRNDFYTKNDHIAAYASFSFDVNMADVFGTILNGGTVYLVPEEIRMNLDDLAAYFEKVGITALLLTTQVGVQFLQNYPKLKSLRMLVMGGEKLPAVEPSGISYTLVNGYGPTENCCGVSLFPIREWEPNIPIGKPLPTIHGYILDKTGHRLPAGAAGEYCLSGPQVSRGYLNRPDKTAEAYQDCPFNEFRMYHTGDIVRYRQSGDVEFVGRKDGQVKIRGFRIETKEVEAVFRSYEGIRDVTVQAYDYENGGKYLAAFIVSDSKVDIGQLTEYVRSQKPAYMVPPVIMQIEKIPLTINQKVDRKALPKPEQKKAEYVAPVGKAEEDFCAVFGSVLGIERVSAEDDFFETGGNSILAMKVVIAAEKAGYKIVYNDVFKHTTPRDLARYVSADSETPAVTVPIPPADTGSWTPPETDPDGYDYRQIHELLSRNTMDAFRNGSRNVMGDVLLLGGTGYLGSHVLHELILHHDSKIFCVVRAGREQSAEQRLKAVQKSYFGDDCASLFGTRITVIEGDATDPDTLSGFEAPSENMTVINCAASVKHFAKGNEIERMNVGSVRNLTAWCEKNGARLVHISTGSVMGRRQNGLPPVSYHFDEHVLYAGQEIKGNQYIYSKYMAERHIYEEILRSGLRAKILRVGNLAPRSSDGEFQINYTTNNFMNTLKAFRTLGVISYDMLYQPTEFSPIDCVAKAVLALACTPDECVCFVPMNPHRPLFGDIIRTLEEIGYPIRGAENDEVAQKLSSALSNEKTSGAVSSLIAYNDNADIHEIGIESLDNSYTVSVLARLGFIWPETGSAYIRRFLEKLEQKGFFGGKNV